MKRFPLEKTILEPFLSHEVEHENILYGKLPEIARRAAENFGNRLYFQDFLQYNFIFQTGVGADVSLLVWTQTKFGSPNHFWFGGK